MNNTLKCLCFLFSFALNCLFAQDIQLSKISMCGNDKVEIIITPPSLPPGCTKYELQLSDENGLWSNPYNFGERDSLPIRTTITANLNIPDVLEDGSSYVIRAVPDCPDLAILYSDTISVFWRPQGEVRLIEGRSLFCKNDTVRLAFSGSPMSTFRWFRNGLDAPFSNNSALIDSSTGNYSLRITRDNSQCNFNVFSLDLKQILTRIEGLDSSYCADEGQSSYVGISPAGRDTILFSPEDSIRNDTFQVSYTEPTERYRLELEPDSTVHLNLTKSFQLSGSNQLEYLPLEFEFEYFGKKYTQIVATSKGIVLFSNSTLNIPPIKQLDSLRNESLDNFIALWSGSFGGGTVEYDTVTIDGELTFVLHYNRVQYVNERRKGIKADYKLLLYSESNIIEIQLTSCSDQFFNKYETHIMGIEGTGLLGDETYLFYQGNTKVENTTVRFIPGEGCSCSLPTIVHDLPDVGLEIDTVTCLTANAFELTGGTPVGGGYFPMDPGTYVGPDSLYFLPFNLPTGDTTVLVGYEYQDPNTGCKNIDQDSIFIAAPPEAALEITNPCENGPTLFQSVSRESGVMQYNWLINGETSFLNQEVFSTTFTEPGNYTIQLTAISTQYGCADTFSENFTIHPLPQFDILTYCPPVLNRAVLFGFRGIDSLAVRSIWWDFGDGEGSDEFFPSHLYVYGRLVYEVSLTIEDTFGCQNTMNKRITLEDDFDFELGIHPNPSSGIFHINVDLRYYTNEVDVYVYDMFGTHVLLQQFPNQPQGFVRLCNINLSRFAPGVYTVMVFANGERINLLENASFFHPNKKRMYIPGRLTIER